MTTLPLKMAMNANTASAIAIRGAGDHFTASPNGKAKCVDDLLSILVLAAQEAAITDPEPSVVGAKVQLSKLGFPGHNIPLSSADRLAIYLLWLWRAPLRDKETAHNFPAIEVLREALRAMSRDPRSATSEMWSRTQTLWGRVETMRAKHRATELEIEQQITPLLPDDLKLAEHQLEMVRAIRSANHRFILTDDMGLGKTIETLASLILLGEAAFPLIIACPLSVTYNWKKEIEKWMAKLEPVVYPLKSHTCGKDGPILIWTKGSRQKKIPAKVGDTTIGWEKGHHVCLSNEDRKITRHHATITRTKDGPCVIENVSGSKTVLVNGVVINSHTLKARDLIEIGAHTITFDIGTYKSCKTCKLFGSQAPADIDAGRNIVLIGSWQQLISHQGDLIQLRPSSIIGDEFHYISNHKSQRAKAFLRVRSSAKHVLGLTGTLEPHGRHREAYAQIKAVAPGAFRHLVKRAPRDGIPAGDWKPYAQRYCGPQSMKLGKRRVTSYDGRSHDVEFGWMLSKYTLRRTKAEIYGEGGLPPKTRYKIDIEVTTTIQMKIARMRDEVREKLIAKSIELESDLISQGFGTDEIAKRTKAVLQSYAVMELMAMRKLVGLLKIPWAISRLKERLEEGDDVVIFCAHNEVADAIHEAAQKEFGTESSLRAYGSMNGNTRGRLVERAQTDKSVRIIVLTRAFREGITLTKFNRLIMVQRWWAPGEESQAEDRVYRIGQTRDVAIDYPTIAGSCDDSMAELAVWKETGQQQVQGTSELRIYEQAYNWVMNTTANPAGATPS